MIIKHRGNIPDIAPKAYIAPTAVIIGKVEIGAGTKILYGAVIDSEGSKITLGKNAIIS